MAEDCFEVESLFFVTTEIKDEQLEPGDDVIRILMDDEIDEI